MKITNEAQEQNLSKLVANLILRVFKYLFTVISKPHLAHRRIKSLMGKKVEHFRYAPVFTCLIHFEQHATALVKLRF